MAKLLIAVRSEDLSAALAEVLPEHEICICHTGVDAQAALEVLQPNALIVQLSLPWGSGLTVLQEAVHTPPVILALTNFLGDHILQAAAKAGVQDMLLLPCTVQNIVRHLNALLQKRPASED